MKTLARIFAAALIGFAAWTCTESEPDKPDTLTLTLNDSFKADSLKYDSIRIVLYRDSVFVKNLFHGPYTDASQLANLELGFLADGNFSLKLLGFRDGVKVLEMELSFTNGDPSPSRVLSITPLDTPEVIITWPLPGHVTNQDSIVIQWGVDSANTGMVVRPPVVFHMDEGTVPFTLYDTNGRGVVGSKTIFVTRASGVLFVNAAAIDSGDGNSWATAYRHLQSALARATDGWDIWVAKGTYKPYEGTGLDPATGDTSFVMKAGIDLFGGFAGTEGDRNLRNWGINETILSGERGDTAITDNLGPVVLGANNATLDGFVVERGWGGEGSGMRNFQVTPQIFNTTFRHNENQTDFGGGGLYNHTSNPRIQNCAFIRNKSNDGGAIMNISAAPMILDCWFQGNEAMNGGAIVSDRNSSALINRSVFIQNSAGRGGAIWDRGASSSDITNSFFVGNSSTFGGGGVATTASDIKIQNSVFTLNSSRMGGGIDAYNSTLTLLNCVLSGNSATDTGGGVYLSAMFSQGKSSLIRNSILWGNSAYGSGSQIALRSDSNSSNSLSLTYSDILGDTALITRDGPYGLTAGAGNIESNPMFNNAANVTGTDGLYFTADDGFNLDPGPCVNTGDPDSTGLPGVDILGSARVSGSRVDIGAYEQ